MGSAENGLGASGTSPSPSLGGHRALGADWVLCDVCGEPHQAAPLSSSELGLTPLESQGLGLSKGLCGGGGLNQRLQMGVSGSGAGI